MIWRVVALLIDAATLLAMLTFYSLVLLLGVGVRLIIIMMVLGAD